jgi:hypothetical protein
MLTGFVGYTVPAVVYVNVIDRYAPLLLRNTQYAFESDEGVTVGNVMPVREDAVIL